MISATVCKRRPSLAGRVSLNLRTPSPPGFSQVLILKGVKVLCFDTLLQVLILKVVSEASAPRFQ
jgi:hypothetical protein